MQHSVPVRDVMSMELITVQPSVTLREIAGTMVRSRVHSVVLSCPTGPAADHRGAWRVISDLDLLDHRGNLDAPAATVARAAPLVVSADESVERCAALLSEHGTGHVLVCGFDGDPVGIASTLDLLGSLADAGDAA